jgi:Mrp family chromosome partitioning ATPase
MESLSNESTPRERLARLLTLMRRTRMFWRSALAILAIGIAVSFALAWNAKRAWRSETTVGYMDSIRTNKDGDSASARAARLGPKLKDLVYARPRLAEVIDEFHLFPEKTAKSMVEAEDEMQGAISFHARQSDTFVVSFTYEDPVIAQKVAARLADNMIEDYNKENLTGATLTRDFLNKKRAEASRRVDDASRGLAEFLALHPQFQWGLNDSPYAATAAVPGPRPPMAAAAPARPRSVDPTLSRLEGDLARVEAQLNPAAAKAVPPPTNAEAQKQREAAAAALAQAEAQLAEKLTVVTPAHPDAVAAQAKVNAARAALAAADTAARPKAAPEPVESSDLAPDVKTRLEHQRAQLRAQLAERRKELAGNSGATEPAKTAQPAAGADKAPKQDVVDLETEWHRLKLDLDRARDELHNVELTAQAADISADAVEKKSQSEMRILDPAYRPTKPDKGKGRVFLIGAVIALFIALGYAGARVLLNDTLLDAGDVLALGGPQPLVAVPLVPFGKPPREREVVRRSQPEVVLADGEPEHAVASAPVVVTAAPVAEPVRQLPAPRTFRQRQATMRWGTRLPVEGGAVAVDAYAVDVQPEPEPQQQRAALAIVPSPILAVGGGSEPPRRVPEVHVIGADLDPHGAGAFALLDDATPELLAALRVLRHRLDQRRAGGPCVVSVVSPGRGEGKSTLAARLAMTLGESDRARVVLVEGNLERPGVAKKLGIVLAPEAGLSHQIHERMLGRKAPWGVVKLGPSLATLAEPEVSAYPGVVHATHFLDAIRALRARYDYVVVDGPSVLGSGDANVLEEVSDVVLVVARAAQTKASALAQAEHQLGESKILGVVLNGVGRPAPRSARRPARPARPAPAT